MKCDMCGSNIDKEWSFCPRCGVEIEQRSFSFPLNKIWNHLNKQMEGVQKRIKGVEKEVVDTESIFIKPKMGGFSIIIKTDTGKQPVLNVETLGGVRKRDIENEVVGIEKFTEPKKTIDPETNIKKTKNRIVIEIDLPIKSEDQIQIKRYEESIEVRAIDNDTMYFKILNVPKVWDLSKKIFENKKLILEFISYKLRI